MNSKKVVALVEPSFYGVDYAKVAFNRGYRVISIVSSSKNPKKYGYEGFYHDLIVADIRDEDSILNAIKMSAYFGKLDAIIPATDYVLATTAKVAERLGLKGMPYQAALKSRNKDLARESYEKYGVAGPRYKKVKSYEEADSAAREIGYPFVLKPTNASSSQNVFFIRNSSELNNAMREIVAFQVTYMDFKVRNEYLIEEYIDGQEFSVEIFLADGEVIFSAVTEKVTTPLPYFVELVHTLPTSVCHEKEDEIANIAIKAVKAIGITSGPSHVEVKLSKEGPKIVEVNGRPGGDNISSDLLIHSTGFNIFEATINYYLDNPINNRNNDAKAASIAYLTGEKKGVVSEVKGLEYIQNNENVVRSHISVEEGDNVSVAKRSDDRLGYVITVGEIPKRAKELALEAIENIKIIYKETND